MRYLVGLGLGFFGHFPPGQLGQGRACQPSSVSSLANDTGANQRAISKTSNLIAASFLLGFRSITIHDHACQAS